MTISRQKLQQRGGSITSPTSDKRALDVRLEIQRELYSAIMIICLYDSPEMLELFASSLLSVINPIAYLQNSFYGQTTTTKHHSLFGRLPSTICFETTLCWCCWMYFSLLCALALHRALTLHRASTSFQTSTGRSCWIISVRRRHARIRVRIRM